MKVFICLISVLLCSCFNNGEKDKKLENDDVENDMIILKVRLVENLGGSKYHWDKVELLEVIEGQINTEIGNQILIAHANIESGITNEISIVTVRKYNQTDGYWLLENIK